MLKVHIMTDDIVSKRGLLGEHGLSLWIERDDKAVLFDTGQSSVYCHNAKAMDINLESTDHIVLSHGHYDHCGGLQYFPFRDKAPSIYAHPDIFLKKFTFDGKGKPFREIGIPWDIYKQDDIAERIIYVQKPLMIDEGIMISGEIPSSIDMEEPSKSFFVEKDDRIIKDMMHDEQMLIIEDEGEIAVFLGCSHRGVISSLNYAQKLFPDKEIKLLAAGMHLEQVKPNRLKNTVQYLMDINIRKVVPLHCTGLGAMFKMKSKLEDKCLICSAGDIIEI